MNKVYLVVPFVRYEGNMSPIRAFTDSETAHTLCNKLEQWLDDAPEYPDTDNEEDDQAWEVADDLWRDQCPFKYQDGSCAPAFADGFSVVEVELE